MHGPNETMNLIIFYEIIFYMIVTIETVQKLAVYYSIIPYVGPSSDFGSHGDKIIYVLFDRTFLAVHRSNETMYLIIFGGISWYMIVMIETVQKLAEYF